MKHLSLYDVGTELEALDRLVEMDQGELSGPHEELHKELGEIIEGRTDVLGERIQNWELEVSALKEKMQVLKDMVDARKNAIARTKDYVKDFIRHAKKKKIAGEVFSFGIVETEKQSVVIENIDVLPIEYLRMKPEAKKADIKTALENGIEIDGCYLQQVGPYLKMGVRSVRRTK